MACLLTTYVHPCSYTGRGEAPTLLFPVVGRRAKDDGNWVIAMTLCPRFVRQIPSLVANVYQAGVSRLSRLFHLLINTPLLLVTQERWHTDSSTNDTAIRSLDQRKRLARLRPFRTAR